MRFEDFAAARLPALLRYAVLLSGDRDEAHDLVQATGGTGVPVPPWLIYWADGPELIRERTTSTTWATASASGTALRWDPSR